MKKFGLIGYPLGHSFSKEYFSEKFEKEGLANYVYDLYPLKNINGLEELINSEPDLCGLNVTIPHKIGVMYYLDQVDEAAKEIDAVNCIKIVNNHPVADFFSGELSTMQVSLHGYNTDAYGFEKSLVPLLQKHHKRALVLGNGGATRAVTYVLRKLDIDYTIVSRKPIGNQLNYSNINKQVLKENTLIINTTPLGMSPATSKFPEIPYEHLNSRHLLYDLVYNPEETEFMKRGAAQGAVVKNGLEMLHLQAEKSWEIWEA